MQTSGLISPRGPGRVGRLPALAFVLLSAALLASGCARPEAKEKKSGPEEVFVNEAISMEVTDYEDFTGRMDSPGRVVVRARVTGYLNSAAGKNFVEGKEVKKGQLLFELDSASYLAEYEKSEANVTLSEAHFHRLQLDYQRGSILRSRGVMPKEEFDKVAGDRAEAEASVKVAKATRDMAKVNLDYCQVRAPISGRISRQMIDPGNLVKADDTILTTIVALETMFAYFDVDERTMLRSRRLVLAGKFKSARDEKVEVRMGLADEKGYSQTGYINFVDNQIDGMTGTLNVRGVFANPEAFLSPGMFVRVRVPLGSPHQATLITEKALGTDQGKKFLFVIKAGENGPTVEKRDVTVGRTHDLTIDELRHRLCAIDKGLMPGERVVISGLQRIRPNAEVRPSLVPIPAVTGTQAPPHTNVATPLRAGPKKAPTSGHGGKK